MSTPTAEQFLMGGGVRAAKFETVGTVVSGVITEPPEVRQQTDIQTGDPLFWPKSQTPKNQLVVTIQTELREDAEDDGLRRIYVKGRSLTNAVRDAVRDAGAKSLDVGGMLKVAFVGEGDPPAKGFNAPKLYQAQYEKPATTKKSQTDFFNSHADTPQPAAPF